MVLAIVLALSSVANALSDPTQTSGTENANVWGITGIYGTSHVEMRLLHQQNELNLGITNCDGVDVLRDAMADSECVGLIEGKGSLVVILQTIRLDGQPVWYKIRANGRDAFVSVNRINEIDEDGFISYLRSID